MQPDFDKTFQRFIKKINCSLSCAALSFLSLSYFSIGAHAQYFNLNGITIEGSGCRNNSASFVSSPGNTGFSVLFDNLKVDFPVGLAGDRIRGCRIRVPVELPPGKMLILSSIQYRGYSSIAQGVWKVLASEFLFQGGTFFKPPTSGKKKARPEIYTSHMYPGGARLAEQGPSDEDLYWNAVYDFTNQQKAYQRSPCGGSTNLYITTVLRLGSTVPSTGDSVLTFDSADGSFGTEVQVGIQDCKPLPAEDWFRNQPLRLMPFEP